MEEPRYVIAPRPGFEVLPLAGDDTVAWYLQIVNGHGRTQEERVGAFIVLLQKSAPLEVRLTDG